MPTLAPGTARTPRRSLVAYKVKMYSQSSKAPHNATMAALRGALLYALDIASVFRYIDMEQMGGYRIWFARPVKN